MLTSSAENLAPRAAFRCYLITKINGQTAQAKPAADSLIEICYKVGLIVYSPL